MQQYGGLVCKWKNYSNVLQKMFEIMNHSNIQMDFLKLLTCFYSCGSSWCWFKEWFYFHYFCKSAFCLIMDAQMIACSLQMTNECLCSISAQYPPFIAVVPISCASFPSDRSSDIQVTLLYWALLTGERELCLSCNAIDHDYHLISFAIKVTHAYRKQSISALPDTFHLFTHILPDRYGWTAFIWITVAVLKKNRGLMDVTDGWRWISGCITMEVWWFEQICQDEKVDVWMVRLFQTCQAVMFSI